MIKKIIKFSDLFIFGISLIANELMLRYFCCLEMTSGLAFVFNFIYFLTIISFLFIFKAPIRKVLEVIIISISSIYCFAQSFHFAFFKTLFSFRKLTVTGELSKVFGEIFDKFNPLFLLFILPIIIVLIYCKPHTLSKKLRYTVIVVNIVLTITFANLIHHFLYLDYAKDKAWQKDFYLLEVMPNKNRYLSRFGLMQYLIKDIELTLNKPQSISLEEEKEIEDFIDNSAVIMENEYTALLEGKNLVMILCESFDESAIREDITPTLSFLQKQGTYFSNYYAPIFQVATGDSEFIAQTAMMPSIDFGTTSYTFHLNHFPNALANRFKEKNYHVNSYHSYISNFYNREIIHESFGFETFYDLEKLKLEKPAFFKETFNWLNDADLFTAMLENTDYSKPFYNFVITASGHMPYRYSRVELRENIDKLNNMPQYANLNDETKAYLASQMLLDEGIRVLLEGLAERNELEDTVILLFGDHYPYGIASKEADEQLLKVQNDYEIYKVPMLIYKQELQAKQIDTLCSTFDLYPTIANLFNLDTNNYYKAGSDVFDKEAKRFVPFEDGSFLTEMFYYDALKDTILNLQAYSDTQIMDEYNLVSKKVNDIFKYSQKILLADYYKK